MAVLFTTATVAPHERFDLWTSVSSRLFTPLGGRPHPSEAFWASAHGQRLGVVELTKVSASGHTVLRTPKYIAAGDPEVFWISMQLGGSSVIRQQERTAVLRSGDVALYDSSHPYSIFSPGRFDMAVFQFPRTLLRFSSELMAGLTATRISEDGGAGAFVVPFLRGLAAGVHAETLPDRCEDLGEGVIALVNAVFAPRVGFDRPAPSPSLLAVKAYIEAHLGDEDLTVEAIAKANHISTRQLYNLFEAEGAGVAEWIRRQRLDRCRRDLRAAALVEVPISRIALEWGFRSPEHFSRAFRAAYGCSPAAYRQGDGSAGGH
jgi:AraC-like DNA-binding protein